MGFFSDMIRMAASEVANAVIDGVNDVVAAQEEQERYLEELEEKYKNMSHYSLVEHLEWDECDVNDAYVIKNILADRAQLVNDLRNASIEEAFSNYSDETFVAHYEKLRSSRGEMFSDEDAETLIKIFQKELMKRPIAKRIYSESKEDYFDETNFESLEEIISDNDIYYDEIMKAEAERELDYRKSLIQALTPDNIDDLDNDAFMKIYALVRADKTKCTYDELDKIAEGTVDFSKYTLYNEYFGKYRQRMLKSCEKEMFENRKYLFEKFMYEYCKDEVDRYYNFSDKKLKTILSFKDIKVNTESLSLQDPEQYDLCDKIIADVILNERGER